MGMLSIFEKFSLCSDQDVVMVPEAGSRVLYNSLSRRDIRSLIFYVLYMHETTQESVETIVHDFSMAFNIEIPKHSEVAATAMAIISSQESLDAAYVKYLENWDISRLSICTKLILRFGVWELLSTKNDPRIVINEAVELAKLFSDDDSYRFVNGILDKISKQ